MVTEEPLLEEWQEESKTVPTLKTVFEVNEKGDVTNVSQQVIEETYKQKYILTKLVPQSVCDEGQHYFVFLNEGNREGGRVLVKCRKCPLGKNFVVGIHELVDGKLVEKTYSQEAPKS